MKQSFFQARKIKINNLSQKLILAGLVIVFIFLARGVWGLWLKNGMAENNLTLSDERLKQLSDRKTLLESKIAKIKTERGVEEEIRSNFSIVKPGEKVINIIQEEKATKTPTSTTTHYWWQIF